ncbi:MAG: hypothetical protein VZQ80_09165 [Lachnospiraceae bacterium]|nr:hypothetical protein [Lachnospiraceae bacterium]
MAFIINAEKAFKDNIRMTKLSKQKQHPRSVRDLFCVSEVHKNGIFRIEDEGRPCLYDKGYLFTDVNYTKKDPGQKKDMLEDFAAFLNSMKADFKITVASEYRDMAEYINEVFCDKHGNRYPEISEGMKMWIGEKAEQAQIHDIEKVMYLTVTTRANTYEEAKLYFSNTEDEIRTKMQILGSELFPLDGETRLDIIRRFFYLDSDKTRIELTNPLNDAVNDVIPFEVETFPNFMIMNGNRYVSVLFARKFDSGLNEEKVAQALTGVPYPSFFTIDYAPVKQDVLMAKLRNADINNERAIAQEIDAKNKNGQAMSGISYQKASKKVEIEGYLDQVDENSETCILADVLVVVTADSEEELALRVDSMKQNAEDVGLVLDTYNQVQVKAFNTALPIGCRLVKCMRAFFSSSLVGLQPFYAEDLIEPGGAFFGINRTTNHLIFANRKALPSPHGIIIGHSGGGKSFLIKSTEIAQTLLSTDDDVTVIDPQNEMDMICDIFHGQFLDLTPKSVIHVNPMEIPQTILEDRTPNRQNNIEAFIADVSDWAFSFCSAAMKNMQVTQEHRSFIGEAVRRLYERAFSVRHLKEHPTIKDLRAELSKMEEEKVVASDKEKIHSIYNALQEYTEGAYDMFAHQSNIDIHNRFVVFGLGKVKQDCWEPVMITIMFFLTARIQYNQKLRRATRFIIDETQVVTENKASAEMLLKAVETYRKFGGICTMAMQNFSRALENPELRDMFSNCGYKCFLDQGGMDANNIALIQQLSSEEFKKLSEDIPGYGVMVWGKKVILLDSRMNRDNPLYEIYSTNFHEKAEAMRNA